MTLLLFVRKCGNALHLSLPAKFCKTEKIRQGNCFKIEKDIVLQNYIIEKISDNDGSIERK